jgi:Transposase zinc-binding domain
MSEPHPGFAARFYDAVYAQVRDWVDNEFYLHRMAAAGGPALEIGVGTGRLFVEARRRGLDVRGIDELLRVWPQRFARQRGPLRAVVERVLREFLRCGLLEHGFARVWCGECRRSVLVAFSCRGRSFCPSCERRRARSTSRAGAPRRAGDG